MTWISTKDSLPGLGKRVLLFHRGEIKIGFLRGSQGLEFADQWGFIAPAIGDTVSHWMELPELPINDVPFVPPRKHK